MIAVTKIEYPRPIGRLRLASVRLSVNPDPYSNTIELARVS